PPLTRLMRTVPLSARDGDTRLITSIATSAPSAKRRPNETRIGNPPVLQRHRAATLERSKSQPRPEPTTSKYCLHIRGGAVSSHITPALDHCRTASVSRRP